MRPLTAGEVDDYVHLTAYAYNLSPASSREWVEAYKEARTLGVFEEGRLGAAFLSHRFDVWVNGRPVRAEGVGGLAAAPERRRRGLVRRLLAEHLRRLRDEGVALSLLYPFSYGFYGRLGWGVGARTASVRIPPAEFAGYGRPVGRVRRLLFSEKGLAHPAAGETIESVIAALDRVYQAEAPAFNLAVRRTPQLWREIFEVGPGRRYVFAWEEAPGEVQGYLILRIPDEAEMTTVILREVFGLTPEAWRGLFRFLADHDSQNRFVQATLPVGHPLFGLLGDPGGVEPFKWSPGPMARAVDVAGLLAAAGTDGCRPGSCVLRVRDALAPWNDGLFEVSFDGDRVTATRAGSPSDVSTPADLETDVAVLSSLAVGAWSVPDVLKFDLATGRPGLGLEFARGLFPARPIWHLHYY